MEHTFSFDSKEQRLLGLSSGGSAPPEGSRPPVAPVEGEVKAGAETNKLKQQTADLRKRMLAIMDNITGNGVLKDKLGEQAAAVQKAMEELLAKNSYREGEVNTAVVDKVNAVYKIIREAEATLYEAERRKVDPTNFTYHGLDSEGYREYTLDLPGDLTSKVGPYFNYRVEKNTPYGTEVRSTCNVWKGMFPMNSKGENQAYDGTITVFRRYDSQSDRTTYSIYINKGFSGRLTAWTDNDQVQSRDVENPKRYIDFKKSVVRGEVQSGAREAREGAVDPAYERGVKLLGGVNPDAQGIFRVTKGDTTAQFRFDSGKWQWRSEDTAAWDDCGNEGRHFRISTGREFLRDLNDLATRLAGKEPAPRPGEEGRKKEGEEGTRSRETVSGRMNLKAGTDYLRSLSNPLIESVDVYRQGDVAIKFRDVTVSLTFTFRREGVWALRLSDRDIPVSLMGDNYVPSQLLRANDATKALFRAIAGTLNGRPSEEASKKEAAGERQWFPEGSTLGTGGLAFKVRPTDEVWLRYEDNNLLPVRSTSPFNEAEYPSVTRAPNGDIKIVSRPGMKPGTYKIAVEELNNVGLTVRVRDISFVVGGTEPARKEGADKELTVDKKELEAHLREMGRLADGVATVISKDDTHAALDEEWKDFPAVRKQKEAATMLSELPSVQALSEYVGKLPEVSRKAVVDALVARGAMTSKDGKEYRFWIYTAPSFKVGIQKAENVTAWLAAREQIDKAMALFTNLVNVKIPNANTAAEANSLIQSEFLPAFRALPQTQREALIATLGLDRGINVTLKSGSDAVVISIGNNTIEAVPALNQKALTYEATRITGAIAGIDVKGPKEQEAVGQLYGQLTYAFRTAGSPKVRAAVATALKLDGSVFAQRTKNAAQMTSVTWNEGLKQFDYSMMNEKDIKDREEERRAKLSPEQRFDEDLANFTKMTDGTKPSSAAAIRAAADALNGQVGGLSSDLGADVVSKKLASLATDTVSGHPLMTIKVEGDRVVIEMRESPEAKAERLSKLVREGITALKSRIVDNFELGDDATKFTKIANDSMGATLAALKPLQGGKPYADLIKDLKLDTGFFTDPSLNIGSGAEFQVRLLPGGSLQVRDKAIVDAEVKTIKEIAEKKSEVTKKLAGVVTEIESTLLGGNAATFTKSANAELTAPLLQLKGLMGDKPFAAFVTGLKLTTGVITRKTANVPSMNIRLTDLATCVLEVRQDVEIRYERTLEVAKGKLETLKKVLSTRLQLLPSDTEFTGAKKPLVDAFDQVLRNLPEGKTPDDALTELAGPCIIDGQGVKTFSLVVLAGKLDVRDPVVDAAAEKVAKAKAEAEAEKSGAELMGKSADVNKLPSGVYEVTVGPVKYYFKRSAGEWKMGNSEANAVNEITVANSFDLLGPVQVKLLTICLGLAKPANQPSLRKYLKGGEMLLGDPHFATWDAVKGALVCTKGPIKCDYKYTADGWEWKQSTGLLYVTVGGWYFSALAADVDKANKDRMDTLAKQLHALP